MSHTFGKYVRCPGVLQAKDLHIGTCNHQTAMFGTGATPINAGTHQHQATAYDCSMTKVEYAGYNRQYVFLFSNHLDIPTGSRYSFYFKDGDKLDDNLAVGCIGEMFNEYPDNVKVVGGGTNTLKVVVNNQSGTTYFAGGVLVCSVLVPTSLKKYDAY